MSFSKSAQIVLKPLMRQLAAAPASMLLLDLDGTLAPFHADPDRARLWANVRDLLKKIRATGRTEIVVMTGRSACETASILGISPPPEIWGVHGAERLDTDGWLERETLSPECREALEIVWNALQSIELGEGIEVERKWNAVAVRWQSAAAERWQVQRVHVQELFHAVAKFAGIHIVQFDGGLELRAGRTKGEAIRLILQRAGVGVPVAYMGDDKADEEVFKALDGHGVGILVRLRQRPSAARAWLRPPHEVRRFLSAWLHAIDPGSVRRRSIAMRAGLLPPGIVGRTAINALR